ncbi:MAG: caspase family protein, partial [Thermoguttaceae bacterium]|nr:caspase family protein [Thermoguttaceae bacterium]
MGRLDEATGAVDDYRVGVWFVASTRVAAANDERGMEVVAKEPEKCGVLVVGVDKYDNLPPLNYASSDAKNIADALKRLGIAEKSVRLLATGVEGSQEPKREEIWKAFEEILAASNEESTVVIALSGHGFEAIKDGETSGDTAFCPADVEARTEKGKTIVKADTAILLKDVVERLQKDDAKFKVLIVDACREPAAIKSVASKGAKSPFNVPQARGLTIFQSCGPEEYSYEDSRVKGGVFTHFFVEELNGEGVAEGVSFWDACKHAMKKTKKYVEVELKQTQNPSLNVVGVEDFWLRPPTDDSGDSWLPWALLALTGGLAGVAVWGRRKPEPKPEPESEPKSKPEPESKPKSKSEPESKPDKRRVVFPLPSAPSEKKERPRETWTLDGVEYAFRSCPSGTFDMGSPATETG